jgi:hypothetical protein
MGSAYKSCRLISRSTVSQLISRGKLRFILCVPIVIGMLAELGVYFLASWILS